MAKKVCTIGGLLLLTMLLLGTIGWANTVESSTMIFQGTLTKNPDGSYTGTIPMTAGAYYVSGGAGASVSTAGGFDVYAKTGGTAYVQGYYGGPGAWNANYPPGNIDTYVIGYYPAPHDAYPQPGGPWGNWYNPDCADWNKYSLELTANHWYLRYTPTGESPMSGSMDWAMRYAAETDLGTQQGNHGGSAIHGGGAGAWDWDCGWGVEVVPLQYPGFSVVVKDMGSGTYQVKLVPTPEVGAPVAGIDSGSVQTDSFSSFDAGGNATFTMSANGSGSLTVMSFADAKQPPAGVPPAGRSGIYLDVLAEGFNPGTVITITYPYTTALLDQLGITAEQFQIYYWDGATWIAATRIALDTTAKTATFAIPASALTGTPIALSGQAASGNQEVDVVDASDGITDTSIDPGDTLLVQAFKIADPGTIGDTVPDGYDTYVETITVEPTPANTLGPEKVEKLYLYRDNGDATFDAASDILLQTVDGFVNTTGGWKAVFGVSGSLLTRIRDNSTGLFFLVAKFAGSGLSTSKAFQTEVSDVSVVDPLGGKGSRLEPVGRGLLPAICAKTFYTRAAASGAAETTVKDDTVASNPQAGAHDVVLQDVTIKDAGHDGSGTNIASITVKKDSGTLDPTKVTKLMLYKETNGTAGFQATDTQLGSINLPDLVAGATFDVLPAPILPVADGATAELYVVANLAANIPVGTTLTTSLNVDVRDGLTRKSPISSRISSALPVVASYPMTIAAAPGAAETIVEDETKARTVLLGETGVVVQTVKIRDPGKDGNPTRIDTITVKGGGAIATNGLVRKLALYVETDGIAGWTSGDTQLAVDTAPILTGSGTKFGSKNTLLLEIPNLGTKTVYIVADFKANGGAAGKKLTTKFTATVFQTAGASSTFVKPKPPKPPLFPLSAKAPTTLSVPLGDNEADLTDETQARAIKPGQQGVVIQQFTIADPGTRGDTLDDGYALGIQDVTVRLTENSTITGADIHELHLYREADGNPGFTWGDKELDHVTDPVLDGRITFKYGPSKNPLDWEVKSSERFYIVADFKSGKPANGDQLRSTVFIAPFSNPVTIKTHLYNFGSGIEDHQPLVANNAITGGTPQATVDIHDLTIPPTGSGDLVISVDTGLLADFQVGAVGKLTITNSDKVNVTDIVGAGPYEVQSKDIVDPNTAGTDITVTFGVTLKPGETPTAGPVVILKITGTGADGDTADVNISLIDVFRDKSGSSISYIVDPGKITLSASAALKGDVNGDGSVDITDARWVAEYAIGIRQLTAAQIAAADVAPPHIPPNTNVDITDARWIAEAAIGLRTLSVLTPTAAPTALPGTAVVSIGANDQLVVSGTTACLADIQGAVYYDPNVVNITNVVGMNGFQVLASSIDAADGVVRFAAANISGTPITDGPIIRFITNGRTAPAAVKVDVLRDIHGRDIPVQTATAAGLVFGNYPNPVTDVHTTTFAVKGAAAALVKAVKVDIYDLSGRLVYSSGEIAGTSLEWHTENNYGEYLANGVYLYKMYAKVNGKWVVSKVKKLVILR